MLQPIEIPVPKVNDGIGRQENQFCELMKEISYACKLVQSKKWTLAQYYNHMAEYFDYIGLPADAQKHREMAKEWLSGIPIGDILRKYISAPSLAEIQRMY